MKHLNEFNTFNEYIDESIIKILNILLECSEPVPIHVNIFGYVYFIYQQKLKVIDSELHLNLRKYLSYKLDIELSNIHLSKFYIPPLYGMLSNTRDIDLSVYNDVKELLHIYITNDLISKPYTITKSEFVDFIDFCKNPDAYINSSKYNL